MTRIPLYPFLFGSFPIIAYYVQNRLELELSDPVRPLLVSICAVALLVVASRSFAKSIDGALILSVILVLSVFSYPFVCGFVYATESLSMIARHRFLLPAWCLSVALVYFTSAYFLRSSKDQKHVTRYMNLFSILLWVVTCFPLAASNPVHHPAQATNDAVSAHASWVQRLISEMELEERRAKAELPDIYYVILDGYARHDILKSRFGFNNDKFINRLRDVGFFVATKSHSNYPWTHLSLSATLNCEYLQTLLPADFGANTPADRKSRYQYFVKQLGNRYIRNNRVRQFLEHFGYTWETGESGKGVTRQPTSLVSALTGPISEFERMLIRKTVFGPLFLFDRYHYVRTQLKRFSSSPSLDRPKFVFFHVISPHMPFCFDELGRKLQDHPIYGKSGFLEDNQAVAGFDQYYRQSYPENVQGLNVHTITAIEELMANTNREAIIIVQSDHGSSLGLKVNDISATDIPERFGILNAIYLPESYSRAGLDETMSAVNTFRVVLSEVFGVRLPKLDDRAWYSNGDLHFTDVTNDLIGVESSD